VLGDPTSVEQGSLAWETELSRRTIGCATQIPGRTASDELDPSVQAHNDFPHAATMSACGERADTALNRGLSLVGRRSTPLVPGSTIATVPRHRAASTARYLRPALAPEPELTGRCTPVTRRTATS